MRDDPIVEEVRKARDKHAARFNYDLNAIAADLRQQEKKARKKYVSLKPKKPVVFPDRLTSKKETV
jgi:hypothetical protein